MVHLFDNIVDEFRTIHVWAASSADKPYVTLVSRFGMWACLFQVVLWLLHRGMYLAWAVYAGVFVFLFPSATIFFARFSLLTLSKAVHCTLLLLVMVALNVVMTVVISVGEVRYIVMTYLGDRDLSYLEFMTSIPSLLFSGKSISGLVWNKDA